MGTIKKLQVGFLAAAALIFAIAVLTKLFILPNHLFYMTVLGLHRVANTLLLFSIATGLTWLVCKKQ